MLQNPVEVPLGEMVEQFVKNEKQADSLRPEMFRDLIQPLSEKRKEYQKLKSQVDAKIPATVRQTASRFRKNVFRAAASFFERLQPFSTVLKWVDSHYGSDVHSYFKFILWMIVINVTTFTVTFFFGMAPSIFWHDASNGSPLLVNLNNTVYKAEDILTGKVCVV